MKYFFFLVLSFVSLIALGNHDEYPPTDSIEVQSFGAAHQNQVVISFPKFTRKNFKNIIHNDASFTNTKKRGIAFILAVTLGPFGVHRLYLGTHHRVPIIYTLTLGGGFFILPLVDILHIVFEKDKSKIENNENIFIWNN